MFLLTHIQLNSTSDQGHRKVFLDAWAPIESKICIHAHP